MLSLYLPSCSIFFLVVAYLVSKDFYVFRKPNRMNELIN